MGFIGVPGADLSAFGVPVGVGFCGYAGQPF